MVTVNDYLRAFILVIAQNLEGGILNKYNPKFIILCEKIV